MITKKIASSHDSIQTPLGESL